MQEALVAMLKLKTNDYPVYGGSIDTLEVTCPGCDTQPGCNGICYCSYGDRDLAPYVCGHGNAVDCSRITDLCHDIDWIELAELLMNWRSHAKARV